MEEGDETDQEDHRVAARSNGVRAEVCWLGRQDIRAVILRADEGLHSSSVGVMLALGDSFDAEEVDKEGGARVKSTSSHQSISVTFWMPES